MKEWSNVGKFIAEPRGAGRLCRRAWRVAPVAPCRPARPAARSQIGLAAWLLLIIVAVLVLPTLVQQIEYAATRGRLQAEAEVARSRLQGKDPGSRNESIGEYRYVVKAIQPSVVGVKATRIVRGEQGDEFSYPSSARSRCMANKTRAPA